MTRTIVALLLAGIAGTATSAFADEVTATFAVQKMDCAMCPLTVRMAMKRVDGVLDAKVDYDTKTATVRFDDARTTPAEIAKASTEIGYPATPNEG